MARKSNSKPLSGGFKTALLTLLLAVVEISWASESSTYRYWTGSGAPGQADYHLELARAALRASEAEFGPFQIEVVQSEMPTRRGRLALRSGDLDFHATTVAENEAASPHFIIVPHALEYGLLGYRNLLVRRDRLDDFAAIEDISPLAGFSVGMGRDWPDVQILRDNGFTVREAFNFPTLFPMLMAERYDYILLGIEEIQPTLEAIGEQFPDIVPVDDVLVVYPLPVYFMVCSCQPELAKRLEVGLKKIDQRGEMERLFRKYKIAAIKQLDHHWRLIIELKNPRLPPFYEDNPSLDILERLSRQ